MQREFRTGNGLHIDHGAEWNHGAAAVRDMELSDVFAAGTKFLFGFDVHLPLAAEAVEIIHKIAAEECLQRLIYVRDVDALTLDFLAIDIGKSLRRIRQIGCGNIRKFLALARRSHKLIQVFSEKLRPAAGSILEDKRYTAGSADARNGRGRK